ncbi:hypothetical protein AAU61_07265 [Desulfocarbo indianensis]|nr:hypothetical protein AAU61_07265 [Desulfocarbo indianensis]
MTSLVLSLIFVAFFVFCIKKNTMRWPVFVFNLVFFLYGLGVTLIIEYALPQGVLIKGSGSDVWPPAVVAMLALAAAVAALVLKKGGPHSNPAKTTGLRWVILAGGVLMQALGMALALMTIYTTYFAQPGGAHAQAVLYVMLAASWLACGLLYLASRFNTAAKPNLMRWMALGSGFFPLGHLPTSVTLILIYAAPGVGQVIHLHAASLQMTAYVPYIVLFTLLARDFQRPEPARQAPA